MNWIRIKKRKGYGKKMYCLSNHRQKPKASIFVYLIHIGGKRVALLFAKCVYYLLLFFNTLLTSGVSASFDSLCLCSYPLSSSPFTCTSLGSVSDRDSDSDSDSDSAVDWSNPTPNPALVFFRFANKLSCVCKYVMVWWDFKCKLNFVSKLKRFWEQ